MRDYPSGMACGWVAISMMAGTLMLAFGAWAQDKPAAAAQTSAQASTAPVQSVTLPEVTVTAQKQPENVQDVPMSVTPVTAQILQDAGITSVKQASTYVPNTFITEFDARKLSNPRIRGVGGSPLNPGVTTYYDGVPQLNGNSSSQELLNIGQIEFLRGPQGTLYGRNSIGGVININTPRPSEQITADLSGSYGNFNHRDVRLTVGGPLIPERLFGSFSFGYANRDGYSRNSVTGNDLDDREAEFAKGQLLFKGDDNWEFRLIMSGEHSVDGDYALSDLNQTRAHPHTVAHDFEGYVRRDIVSPTLQITHKGDAVDFTSVTGFVWWDTQDRTDLDYTATPIVIRNNSESETQITQEFRLASDEKHPLELCKEMKLKWQAGVFVFNQNYDQQAANNFNPLIPGFPFGFNFFQPQNAHFNDTGVGVFGQATLIAWEKLDLTAGLRFDYESKSARTFATSPSAFLPNSSLDDTEDFTQLSPKFVIAYHVTDNIMPYGSASKGYRAGGFNATFNPGSENYDEETSWTYEVGVKTQWLDKRLEINAAAYYLQWENVQLNSPVTVPAPTGQFFIANAGDATSQGLELEAIARPLPGWDIFFSGGVQKAEFLSGGKSLNSTIGPAGTLVGIGGNQVPYSPDYTLSAGTQIHHEFFRGVSIYGRAEVTAYGSYTYDEFNQQSQDAYNVVNFRAGLRGGNWYIEGWVANAFDTHYVPVALQYPNFAASGYVGEPGAPRTFGVTLGVIF